MSDFVVVGVFDKVFQADWAVNILESEGIQCYLQDENVVGMDWFLANAVGGIKLLVSRQDATTAIELLAKSKRPQNIENESDQSDLIEFACENCGAQIKFPGHRRGGVETCPKCKCYVDVPD